jgi:hypothetical protein
MAATSIEKRLASVEAELARLKARVENSEKPWWEQIWGSFANDPAFLEAMRYGREYRESLRPKSPKRRRR